MMKRQTRSKTSAGNNVVNMKQAVGES